MKNQKIYNAVLKAAKRQDPENYNYYYCSNCIVHLIKEELNKAGVYTYEGYHKCPCGSTLFYLEDLGIIKILSGGDRRSGVECYGLKIKILNIHEGNKI